MKSRWRATPSRVGWVEDCVAERFGLRRTVSRCDGVSGQAGSRPGGRLTFWQQHQKVSKECRPASTPRLRRGALRCSKHRVAAELALATLGAQTVLATAALRASEPDASVLLGVSEGNGKASTFHRCLYLADRMQAVGRTPGSASEPFGATSNSASLHPRDEQSTSVVQAKVLTFGSRRERRVAQRDREEGRGLSELRAQRGRVPQAPGCASNAGKSGATRPTANAGCPCLWFLSLGQARERNPAAGTDSRPMHVGTPTTSANNTRKLISPNVGVRETHPNLRSHAAEPDR
ncbi:hypothetical protein GGR36_002658 [Niveibacterium umoris]|uniref:Uncharacterized protein n=1 Tax=Niveibacterium umoris TaxID=1193620 RepID=A0A840BNT2_9RHOO|nr:hypothetical protein [Niveibacterium umoris]